MRYHLLTEKEVFTESANKRSSGKYIFEYGFLTKSYEPLSRPVVK